MPSTADATDAVGGIGDRHHLDPVGRLPDPTANVKNLLITAIQRIDDLREADIRRINELMSLRADYTEKLAVAEAKRIDAIRSVDVNAVAVAAERAAAQASVLANQVSSSADTLRSLVAATATTIAQQLSTLTQQLTDRISALEKSQYTTSGTTGATTPATDAKFAAIATMMETLAIKVGGLQESRSVSVGKTTQSSIIWGAIAVAVAAATSVILLVLKFAGH